MFLHKMLIQQQCVKLNYKHLPERGSYIDLHNWNPSLDGLFPGGSVSNEATCNVEDLVSIPGLGSSPGERNGSPFQCSCLENSMDRTEKLSFFPLHCSGFEKETKQSSSMVSWERNLTFCVCVWQWGQLAETSKFSANIQTGDMTLQLEARDPCFKS